MIGEIRHAAHMAPAKFETVLTEGTEVSEGYICVWGRKKEGVASTPNTIFPSVPSVSSGPSHPHGPDQIDTRPRDT